MSALTGNELLLAICGATEKCPGFCFKQKDGVFRIQGENGPCLDCQGTGCAYALGYEIRLECPQCHGRSQRYSGRGFRFGSCPDCQVRGWIPNPDMAALLRMIRARRWFVRLFQHPGWDEWIVQDSCGHRISETEKKDGLQDDDALRLATARALGVAKEDVDA